MTTETDDYRILRWTVPVDDRPHTFPLSGAILHVASRSVDTVTFWTLATGPDTLARTFQVVGTGQPFPSEWKHRGTALAADGALGWHLMEQP